MKNRLLTALFCLLSFEALAQEVGVPRFSDLFLGGEAGLGHVKGQAGLPEDLTRITTKHLELINGEAPSPTTVGRFRLAYSEGLRVHEDNLVPDGKMGPRFDFSSQGREGYRFSPKGSKMVFRTQVPKTSFKKAPRCPRKKWCRYWYITEAGSVRSAMAVDLANHTDDVVLTYFTLPDIPDERVFSRQDLRKPYKLPDRKRALQWTNAAGKPYLTVMGPSPGIMNEKGQREYRILEVEAHTEDGSKVKFDVVPKGARLRLKRGRHSGTVDFKSGAFNSDGQKVMFVYKRFFF